MDYNSFVHSPKGTKDYFDIELKKINYIISKISFIFKKHGFRELKTPAFEYVELIKDVYGGECNKLIYNILNSGIDFRKYNCSDLDSNFDNLALISDKCLRYDLTLPLIRYVCNNMTKINFPFKRYQIQPVWRADKPQKGRFREFYQCDIDIIGSDSLLCECELIQVVEEAFVALGLENYEICINNRGIINDICTLLEIGLDRDRFCTILDKIDKIGVESFLEEISDFNIKNEKLEILKEIIYNKSDIKFLKTVFVEYNLSLTNIDTLSDFIDLIKKLGINVANVVIDFSLVRGLSYYTGLIYEVRLKDVKIGSVVGGGRYGYFAERFNDSRLCGAGISFGISRICTAMEELNLFDSKIDNDVRILITNVDNSFDKDVVSKLRVKYIVEYYYNCNDSLKQQLKFANKSGFKYVVIGENIKNMETGEICTVLEFLNKYN